MLNSLNNAYELFKVQTKWNAKSVSFWLTISFYVMFSTGISLLLGIIGIKFFQQGDLNDGNIDQMFITLAIVCHIVMVAILISVFSVRVFVNNVKHKVVELEKNAGYNKLAIFYSRLLWLMTTVFSTIFINFLFSAIIFLMVNKDGYSEYLYAIFIGLFGWETVFALTYMLLFLVILFLMGPTRASLLIIVILFLFNTSPLLNVSSKINQERTEELEWTIDKNIWFNDLALQDDTLSNIKNFFNEASGNNYGYEYAIRLVGDKEQFEEDYKLTKSVYDQIAELTSKLNWTTDDVYLFSKSAEKINKTVYDLRNEWLKMDFSIITDDNKTVFEIINHYINDLDTWDKLYEYNYNYWDNAVNINRFDYFYNAYNKNPALGYMSTLVRAIFKTHRILTEKVTFKNESGNIATANTYEKYVDAFNKQGNYYDSGLITESRKKWYIDFNPTKSEVLGMVFNPFTHISLMQKSSQGMATAEKDAFAYVNTFGMSALYNKNVKIVYNDDGSISYERIIHTEWIFVFYTLLTLGLLPLTYLLWRRKNK